MLLCCRVVCRLKDTVDGGCIKPAVLGAVSLVFHGRWQAQRLGEVLLVDADDPVHFIKGSIEAANDECFDTVEFLYYRLGSFEPERRRQAQCLTLEFGITGMGLIGHLYDVGGRRARAGLWFGE